MLAVGALAYRTRAVRMAGVASSAHARRLA